MSVLHKTFETDKKAETEGVWMDYGPSSRGEDFPTRIKIARSGGENKEFQKALELATKPFRKALQTGSMSNERAEQLFRKVFVEKVVLDWENVETKDGEFLPFTPENVERILTELPDLYLDLKEMSGNLAIFRAEVREADLGNSGRSSNTDGSKDRSNS